MEANTTLRRMKEREVLQRFASGSKLEIILDEKGLAYHDVNLL